MTNVSASADSVSVIAPFVAEPFLAEPRVISPLRRDAQRIAAGLPKAIRNRSGDITLSKVAALFILLLAITSIPIALHPWPPMSDYINHLARMQVIANISTDPDLARFYEIDWQLIPNLMMDLIVPSLVRVMNVYRAGQVYTIASFVLILSGPIPLHRQ